MKDVGIVCGETAWAKPLIIGTDTVYIHSNIKPLTDENGEIIPDAFSYNEIQYSKDEYIQIMAEQKILLEQEITNVQLALCDLFEQSASHEINV